MPQCWDSSEHDLVGPDPCTVDELLNRTRPKPLGGWGNPVCDPVYVEGAEPGDTLQVEILQLRSGDWGWTCITDGFGLLAGNDDGLFPEPKLGIWRVDRERGLCTLDGAEGVTVPYRPMLGCIGVAPPRSALWETGINSMPGRGDMPAVRNNAPMLLLPLPLSLPLLLHLLLVKELTSGCAGARVERPAQHKRRERRHEADQRRGNGLHASL